MRNMRHFASKDDGLGQHLQRLAHDESALAAALKHVTASTECFLEVVESVETSNDECSWSGFEPPPQHTGHGHTAAYFYLVQIGIVHATEILVSATTLERQRWWFKPLCHWFTPKRSNRISSIFVFCEFPG